MAPTAKSDKKGGSASTGKAAGKYRKLEQLPEEEEERKAKSNKNDDEEAQPAIKKKKKKAMNLNALPEEPIELKCPLCGHEGDTVLKKSMADRGKIAIFYIAITIFIAVFFIFILLILIVQQVVFNRGRNGGCTECCSCKNLYKMFSKCQPKVHSLHYCEGCNKQLGTSK